MIFLSIDLQPEFIAARNEYIKKIAQEEVKRAIRFNYGIVFLEYASSKYSKFSPTWPEIKELAAGYKNQVTVLKKDDDGGSEVMDAAFAHKLKLNKVRVCGVNTDMCVHDTVRTLSTLSPASKIIIRKDGCGSSRKNDFTKFEPYRNVKIIDGK